MKTVCKGNTCVGCMACLEACNKSAITIKDALRSYNAIIDERLCVNCGACYKVCQNNREVALKKTIQWKQGWSENQRNGSSSGGAAASLISAFIQQGGVVCSCAFKNGRFGFFFAPDEIEQEEYKGSKYVKSNPEGIYKKIANALSNEEKVLFIGLPCQVAAVKGFVDQRLQKKLFTVDLICHGTPSPKLLEMFLKDYDLALADLREISFRKKASFRLRPGAIELERPEITDTYTCAFLNALDYTENCYHCRYARQERVSDITIGDSWGSALSGEEQQKGISLILCQTEKGEALANSADLRLLEVDYASAVEANHQLRHPSVVPAQRENFFDMIAEGKGFGKAVRKCYPKFWLRQSVKRALLRIGIYRGKRATDYGICVILDKKE